VKGPLGNISGLGSSELVKPLYINPPAPRTDAIDIAAVPVAVFLGEDAAP
jgi:hypothetical protein